MEVLLGQWLAAGREIEAFWTLTPREVVQVLQAEARRQARDWDERRALNHHLAGLIAYAYHAPGKMPSFEAAGAEAKPVDPEIGNAQVRSYLRGLATRRKGTA